MNTISDTLSKFYACDSLLLGALIYVGHRFVPGPEAVSSMLSVIPGFSNQVSVGSAVVVGLLANIISQKISSEVCAM